MTLRRLPDSRFSEVMPAWNGEIVAVLGCGPSLTLEQVDMVRAADVRCIAVNDAYLVAPWANVQYAADAHWHRWHTEGIAKPMLGMTAADVRDRWRGFRGQKCSIQDSGGSDLGPSVHIMRNRDHPGHGFGLSMDRRFLVTGRNSGFQALNLAVLAGAVRVLLIGFDGYARAGVGHFHGGHPRPTSEAAYPLYRQAMSEARVAIDAAGVAVLNCSPGSAIDAFPRVGLESALSA